MARAIRIRLSKEERQTLVSWTRRGTTERRLAERARMILAAGEGKTNREIAAALGTRPARVSKWRMRFVQEGLEGLKDAPRGGPPPRYDRQTELRILAVLDEPPPDGQATWTGSLVAKRLGDVSAHHVWRVLKRHGISLQRRRSWCVSTDPEFARKAADIVGLYLDPPQDALVLSVDEKPHIQALERAQGWLRLANGKALTGFTDQYKRHGTTTLFAALEVSTGLVKTGHFYPAMAGRRDFLAFMNELVASYPDTELHVILDNLNTHKPKNDPWSSRHPDIHFHYTPTKVAWLNQIEIWFSILSRRGLKNRSFTSPRQLRDAIDRFLEAYNKDAQPFRWLKKRVYQKRLTKSYAYLDN
jgi:transposase